LSDKALRAMKQRRDQGCSIHLRQSIQCEAQTFEVHLGKVPDLPELTVSGLTGVPFD
jgi:hypothetical protein